MYKIKNFNLITKTGFHLKFENGYVLSTQFGYGSYSENYMEIDMTSDKNIVESNNCEIAIWNEKSDDMWCTKEIFKKLDKTLNDDVAPNVNFNEWLRIIDIIKKL